MNKHSGFHSEINYHHLNDLLRGRAVSDGACPLCGPTRQQPFNRKRKVLRAWHLGDGAISFRCARCGASGVAFRDERSDRVMPPKHEVREGPSMEEIERIEKARWLYHQARPADDEGRAYFEGRGLDWLPEVARQMRFARVFFRGFDGEHPALIMPLYTFDQRHLNAVHKIALDLRDGANKRIKRTGGVQRGAAMMLGRPGGVLAVCEGLETGVGAIMGGVNEGAAVWCLGGTSGLQTLTPQPNVERLIVMADNDISKAGQQAAWACASLWSEDADVKVVKPRRAGTDFADTYRRA